MLVGALNMGEYAYDFTGENVHDGASRNPHDLDRDDRRLVRRLRRRGGGRSGAARARLRHQRLDPGAVVVLRHFRAEADLRPAVAGAHISVRRKPRSSRAVRAHATRDLALAYDAMQGHDADDPVCADRPAEPVLPALGRGVGGLRIAVAGGYFRKGASFPEALEAVAQRRQGARRPRARSKSRRPSARVRRPMSSPRPRARRCISTACARAPSDFDPAVRDRLIAGAMVPAALVDQAQKFRRWYRARMLELFGEVDVILAPATPCTAPAIGQQTFVLDGVEMPLAPQYRHLHAADFVHRPAGGGGAVPLEPLPIAVQIIAAPWREEVALRVAYALEQTGVAAAPRPRL